MRAKSIIDRRPIRSPSIPNGTRKNISKSDAIKRINSKSNAEAPMFRMNKGRIGESKNKLIDHRADIPINRYSCLNIVD